MNKGLSMGAQPTASLLPAFNLGPGGQASGGLAFRLSF
jgi:hypothetical protein